MSKPSLSPSELRNVFLRVADKLCVELFQNGFLPEHDHYQMVAEEDRYKFKAPELEYGSLFDDVQELKKLANDRERACSIVECRRLAAVLLEAYDRSVPVCNGSHSDPNIRVNCDEFTLEAELIENSRKIRYTVHTDLPVGTLVTTSLNRSFVNPGSQPLLWIGFNTIQEVKCDTSGHRGTSGVVDIDKSDKDASVRSRQLYRDACRESETRLGDTATVRAAVCSPQSLREFGRRNSRLFGRMVREADGARFIEAEATFELPMRAGA